MEEGRRPRTTLPVVFEHGGGNAHAADPTQVVINIDDPVDRSAEAFFEELARRVEAAERANLTQEHDSLETSAQETPALTTAENRELVYSLSGVIAILERMHDDFDRSIDLLVRARDALELTPASVCEYDQVEAARELLNIVNRLLTDKINKQMALLATRLGRFNKHA